MAKALNKKVNYNMINRTPDHLYVNPTEDKSGAYASIAADSPAGGGEETLAEIDVSTRIRLVVKMFHVTKRNDWNSLTITKRQLDPQQGWYTHSEVSLNSFTGAKLTAFLEVLSSLDLTEPEKAKIDLGEVTLSQLSTLLKTDKGRALLDGLSHSPGLEHDIIAIAAKRRALGRFEELMTKGDTPEPEWQAFFEANKWVFGYGLGFVFLTSVDKKLETVTTGATFNRPGKRADALLRTRAAVSQCVLVEIKRSDTDLLQEQPYRSGTWGVSHELSNAVTQAQKTASDFKQKNFKITPKDKHGTDAGEPFYAVEPRTYLIIGHQSELRRNDDKIACFELYRRYLRTPEIITFDELYERAKCIVEQFDPPKDPGGSR